MASAATAAAGWSKRHQHLFEISQLQEASDTVEELRAALTVSAAAEEASRLEVAGLQRALQSFRQEEEERYRNALRQQADDGVVAVPDD